MSSLCLHAGGKLGWDEDRFYGGAMDDGRWAWVPVFTYDWEQRQKEVTNA
jgi:hypothetical protein